MAAQWFIGSTIDHRMLTFDVSSFIEMMDHPLVQPMRTAMVEPLWRAHGPMDHWLNQWDVRLVRWIIG